MNVTDVIESMNVLSRSSSQTSVDEVNLRQHSLTWLYFFHIKLVCHKQHEDYL